MQIHQRLYDNIQIALKDPLDFSSCMVRLNLNHDYPSWCITKLALSLPKEYTALEKIASLLPNHPIIPSYPFCCITVNINVATWGHQDSEDLILCKVIPVGTFTGGELVLWEPGLVVELPSGSDIVFPSWKITHFNLDYVGERASLVLHTDKEMARWVGDRNRWADNLTLQTYA